MTIFWPVSIRVAGLPRRVRTVDEIISATVVLVREPNNSKDENAIAVLAFNNGVRQMLGYIPREISITLKRFAFPIWGRIVWKSEGQIPGIRIQV